VAAGIKAPCTDARGLAQLRIGCVIAHIDLDSFFVAVELARDPALRGRPLIIGGRPDGQGVVAAASREARRCGIRAGLPLCWAARRCADAVFLNGALDRYLAASVRVDDILRRAGREIEWVSIDEAFVGLQAGSRPLDALERIRQDLHEMGLDAACGLARTKVVARIASQLARPRGVVHVLDGYEARFLSPLKIELLPGLDPALSRRLRAAGIRRLGQLVKLSEPQVSRLAGRAAAALAERAAGIDPSPVRRSGLPRGPLADDELAEPTTDRAALEAALRTSVERFGRDLRSRGVFARSVTLRVRYADGRLESRTAALREPSALDDPLHAAAAGLLGRLARPERLVRAIGVSGSGMLEAAGEPSFFPVGRH
jgi:DNA polymerase-4